jgi:hypothetical protein
MRFANLSQLTRLVNTIVGVGVGDSLPLGTASALSEAYGR